MLVSLSVGSVFYEMIHLSWVSRVAIEPLSEALSANVLVVLALGAVSIACVN